MASLSRGLRWFVAVLAAALIAFQLHAVFFQPLDATDTTGHETRVLLRLGGAVAVHQTFAVQADEFDGVTFHTAPVSVAPAAPVVLELFEIAGEPAVEMLLFREVRQARELAGGAFGWRVTPAASSRGKRFALRASMPATPLGEGIALLATRDEHYRPGQLAVDDKSQWGDLVFTTSARRATLFLRLAHVVMGGPGWLRPVPTIAAVLLVHGAAGAAVLWVLFTVPAAPERQVPVTWDPRRWSRRRWALLAHAEPAPMEPASVRPRRRVLPGLAFCGVVIGAPVLVLAVVWSCAVDVPRWDEWEFARFLARAADGDLQLAGVLEQYNDHRMAVPRIVLLAFARATDWNLRAQALVAPALAALTLLLIARVGRRSAGEHRVAWLAATAVTSVFVFSPTQDDNWMLALQHAFFLPGVCMAGILAVAGARWPSWARWLAAASLAVIACLSVSSGFLLWIVAVPALWWPPDLARQKGRGAGLALWTAMALVTAWLFLENYVVIPGSQPLVHPIVDAAQFWPYFFAFLGAPFARGTAWPTLTLATFFGTLLFATFVATAWEALRAAERRRAAMPWLVLGAIAAASAAAGAMMRSGFGQNQSMSSRYATFSLMLPIALTWLAMVPQSRHTPHEIRLTRWRVAAAAVLLVSLAFIGLSSLRAIEDMARLSRSITAARAALGFLGHVPDTKPLAILYPSVDLLPALAEPLWKAGWLRPPHRGNAIVPGAGDVEGATDSGRIEEARAASDAVTIAGWAMLPRSHTPADLVAIAAHSTDGPGQVVAFGVMQTDIARVDLGPPGDVHRTSAWSASVARSSIPSSAIALSAWALDGSSGRAFRLSGTVDLPQAVVR